MNTTQQAILAAANTTLDRKRTSREVITPAVINRAANVAARRAHHIGDLTALWDQAAATYTLTSRLVDLARRDETPGTQHTTTHAQQRADQAAAAVLAAVDAVERAQAVARDDAALIAGALTLRLLV